MSGGLRYTVIGPGLEVRSDLTGRPVTVNQHLTRFLVPPTFSARQLAEANNTWQDTLAGLTRDNRYACARFSRWAAERVLAAATPDAYARSIDDLAAALVASRSGGVNRREAQNVREISDPDTRSAPVLSKGELSRASELLLVLHRHGCLLAPAAEIRAQLYAPARFGPLERADLFFGEAAGMISEVLERAAGNVKYVRGPLLRLHMSMQGLVEVGDITTATLSPFAAVFARESSALDAELRDLGTDPYAMLDLNLRRLLVALQKAQQARYGSDPRRRVPTDYHELRGSRGARHRPAPKADARNRRNFPYLERNYPSHAAWVVALREHIQNVGNRMDLQASVAPLDTMMRALLALEGVPPSPLAFCGMGITAAELLRGVIFTPKRGNTRRATYLTEADGFFEYVLGTQGLLSDGGRDPRYRNPVEFIKRPPPRRKPGQTKRKAMPPWLVRAVRDLLVSDDYAWPRSLERDYFTVVTSSGVETVWSPVLAELTLLRLMLPLRVLQARLLGSGEGDTWVWVDDGAETGSGSWVPNEGPWRPPAGEQRQFGFLRRMFDSSHGAWIPGLYISTNKTADRENGFEDLGYEIGWCSREIIALFERVRGFQAAYNPPRAPKSRAELNTEPLAASEDVAVRLPRMHYLFRDRCDPEHPDEPVTRGRVRTFWCDMMAELERRFAADPRGPRAPDGAPYPLLRETGTPEYDLHSVRVTGITALALNGCPIEVIMMLAGHSSWLMTVHYVKPSPADLRGAMDRAAERMSASEGESWEAAAAALAPEVLEALRVANSPAAMEQLEGARSAFVMQMDFGLCPNGGALCNEGGPEVRKGVHGPVPGGAANCQSCRFLVSGPQFLGGLIARLNHLSVEVIEAGAVLRTAEARRRNAIAEERRAEAPRSRRAGNANAAEAAVAAAEERVQAVAVSWQNLMALIRRCESKLRDHMATRAEAGEQPTRSLVVLNGTLGDFEVQLERCSDYDLLQRVCEDSEVWAHDSRPSARMRGARLDRVLAAAGQKGVFAGLSEEESLAVGNLFGRWLRTRLGATDHADVLEGRRTLSQAGIIDEANEVLAGVVNLQEEHLFASAPRRLSAGATE